MVSLKCGCLSKLNDKHGSLTPLTLSHGSSPQVLFPPNPSVTTALKVISGEEEYVDPLYRSLLAHCNTGTENSLDRVRQRVAEMEAEQAETRRNTTQQSTFPPPRLGEHFNPPETPPSIDLEPPVTPTRIPRWISRLESTLTIPDWELPSIPRRSCTMVLAPQLPFICSDSRKCTILLLHLPYLLLQLHPHALSLHPLDRITSQKLPPLNVLYLLRRNLAKGNPRAK